MANEQEDIEVAKEVIAGKSRSYVDASKVLANRVLEMGKELQVARAKLFVLEHQGLALAPALSDADEV